MKESSLKKNVTWFQAGSQTLAGNLLAINHIILQKRK